MNDDLLPCPLCGALTVSPSEYFGRPAAEDDLGVICQGCGARLSVSITTLDGVEAYEIYLDEYSGEEWRHAIEDALGLPNDPENHTPEELADMILERLGGGQKE